MNVVGLITEYNPLHYGHVYHYEQAKKHTQADAVVIIMSGNFLQRGEPALVNKWARAQMALDMGADLIIELPYAFATQQAEWFAFGAVSLLHRLPFVTHLCFGSEDGDIERFQQAAKVMQQEPPHFKKNLRETLEQGHSYPAAYARAINSLLEDENVEYSFFQQPNNILGLHYVKAILDLNSRIQPTTIKRTGAGYHDQMLKQSPIASATAIRKKLFAAKTPDWKGVADYVPHFTLQRLQQEYEQGRGPIRWEDYFPYIQHLLLSQTTEQLGRIYEMTEGIEYRLQQKAKEAQSVEQLCQLTKSKRYTWNRIQRMILHTYTQVYRQQMHDLKPRQGAPYFRLLGFSKRGQQLLNQYKKKLTLPVIASVTRDQPGMLEMDLKTSILYTLGYEKEVQQKEKKRELLQSPLGTHI